MPKGLKCFIMFSKLDNFLVANNIRDSVNKVIEKTCSHCQIQSVRMMGELDYTLAVVELRNDSETQALYESLNGDAN